MSCFIGPALIGHEAPSLERPEELLNSLLPQKGLAVLVGDPGAGKSLLAILLASTLATDKSFVLSENGEQKLGKATHKGGTLYLAGEGYEHLHLRIKAAYETDATQNPLPELGAQLPIISMRVADLNGRESTPLLETATAKARSAFANAGYPIRLLVLDTLSATYRLNDENSNSEMQRAINWLRDFGAKLGCLVLVTTHPAKSFRSRAGSTRGASALEGSADVVWHLKKMGKTSRRKLTIIKQRDGQMEDKAYEFEIKGFGQSAAITPVLSVTKDNPRTSSQKLTANDAEVLKCMTQLGLIKPTNNDVYSELGMAGVQYQEIFSSLLCSKQQGTKEVKSDALRQQIKRGLKRLCSLGILEIDGNTEQPIYIPNKPWAEMSRINT